LKGKLKLTSVIYDKQVVNCQVASFTAIMIYGCDSLLLAMVICRRGSIGNMMAVVLLYPYVEELTSVLAIVRWKVHESTLLGIGSLSKLILEHVSTHKLPLDINTFLQNVVLVDLNQNGEFCEVLL